MGVLTLCKVLCNVVMGRLCFVGDMGRLCPGLNATAFNFGHKW
jgi:hypothetical protein